MKDGALVKARKACEEVPAQRSIEATMKLWLRLGIKFDQAVSL